MQYRLEGKNYVLVLARGEKVIASITQCCRENNIHGGFFTGLGAVENPTLAHYSVPDKKYSKKTLTGAFELTNITGSIGFENPSTSLKASNLIVHAHVTLSDETMTTFGGHLIETIVGGTVELIVIPMPKLVKAPDAETGLKLFLLS